jgi:2-oxoglutarate dehydrogenase E1 component
MRSDPITSVFNDGYIAETYEAYRQNPASVDESWRQFFRFAERLSGSAGSTDPKMLRKVAGAAALADAIRGYGHLNVQIDPLGATPPGAPELTPEFHGISEEDLATIPGDVLGVGDATASEAITRLRTLYSSTIGFEFEHIGSAAERQWLRESVESGSYHKPLTKEEGLAVLRRLTEVDTLERFLGRAYQGYKRFSIEGSDALVPMLDECVTQAGRAGAKEIVIGMAHRGRINVLVHILDKPYAVVFNEFEGKHPAQDAEDTTGDVKYHLGYATERVVDGKPVALTLVPNPSHLEFVNPVLEGVARAKQRTNGGARDEATVVPICIHGDAAFIGEGVVAETLNLSLLRGFRTGGTIHIIVNNQVGFTTDPIDGRSTRYASDLAKGFDIPILHVNGDNPEAYIQAIRLAVAYRSKFNKDILIDLVSYRRHGHNETDEPAFTQPTLYQKIRAHKTPREVFAARLANEGVLTAADADALQKEVMAKLEGIHASPRDVGSGAGKETGRGDGKPAPSPQDVNTAVPAQTLTSLNEQLLQWPQTLKVNSRLARTLARRRDAMGDAGGIDWGHAEALAFSSLLIEGTSIRLTGQDAERGTFSHRQAVLHDSESGETYVPLQHLKDTKGTFEVYNSPLSETAVLGFEYGFSVEAKDALVLWEAQYGDFANVAQPIVDQFLSSDRAKWSQDSGVTMLLPHGYEGGGPEHSSARLERYLQLCAENNMRVAYPSTPAQYFHILRRQAKASPRRPLVLMQPKSLLRLPEAASKLSDLVEGSFRPVIDDPIASQNREQVRRLVFCTGKIYYDLLAQRRDDVALVRVEELYPWPHDEIAKIVDSYPAIEDVVWAQEEPKNMGAWSFLWPRLRVSTGNAITVRYIGRPERASPAEGYTADHNTEQKRIVNEVFELSEPVPGKRAKAAAR